ncbi:MAG: thermonuclease family protein [Cypionkella sp.]
MNVVRFNKRRPPVKQRDVVTPILALVALVAVCVLGWVAIDQYIPGPGGQARQEASALPASGPVTASFGMCGRDRFTCVVDGDTIWYQGVNLRLQSYDTPEPYTQICGGDAEVALAKRASARLLQLLNSNAFKVDTFGLDNTGERTLATIRIHGRDVGEILIEEHLARRWPDGDEWWCS